MGVSLTLASCETDFSAKSGQVNSNSSKQGIRVNTDILQDTAHAKKWITKVITGYINNDDLKVAFDNMRTALTENYYNYKQDAITLEYSEDLTEKEFHQKWKAKYDTKYVGNGGFFTSAQDNGLVDVPVCVFLKSLGDTAKVFHTVIRDLRWKTDYVMDITVVCKGNKLLIDDVKEYE